MLTSNTLESAPTSPTSITELDKELLAVGREAVSAVRRQGEKEVRLLFPSLFFFLSAGWCRGSSCCCCAQLRRRGGPRWRLGCLTAYPPLFLFPFFASAEEEEGVVVGCCSCAMRKRRGKRGERWRCSRPSLPPLFFCFFFFFCAPRRAPVGCRPGSFCVVPKRKRREKGSHAPLLGPPPTRKVVRRPLRSTRQVCVASYVEDPQIVGAVSEQDDECFVEVLLRACSGGVGVIVQQT